MEISAITYLCLCAFLLKFCSCVDGCEDLHCDSAEAQGLLEAAKELISRAQGNIREESCACRNHCPSMPTDCSELKFLCGHNDNGVYTIWPKSRSTTAGFDVYCDMDTEEGGWTVVQRRGDYGRSIDYFVKDWASYKEGFGDLHLDFWLGNEKLNVLTNQAAMTVRFDLEDWEEEKRFAEYDYFWIEDESRKYQVHVGGYRGNAGDSFSNHSSGYFTTKDRDNDEWEENCSERFKGGWWYKACHFSNPNGLYLDGEHESFADGVEWCHWKGYNYSLKATEIKIRQKKFR